MYVYKNKYLVITSLNVLELFLRTSFESFFEVVDLDELMFYAKQCLMYRVSLDWSRYKFLGIYLENIKIYTNKIHELWCSMNVIGF